jgi:hypothetical protein
MSAEKAAEKIAEAVVAMPIPAFGDLGKAANDVCQEHVVEEMAVLENIH